MNRNKLDLEMSTRLLKNNSNSQAVLGVDEGATTFNIFYEVYDIQQTEYFYIKLVENSAVAPFYYNRSYTIEELHELNDIFKSTNLKKLKTMYLKGLFEERKVSLSYKDNNKEIVIMELTVSLFAESFKVEFELHKEMIPECEKDDKLIELYNIDKNYLKTAKEMMKYLKANKINLEPNLFDKFNQNFDLSGDNDNKETITNNITNNINVNNNNPTSPPNNNNENLILIEPELEDKELQESFNKTKNGKKTKEDDKTYEYGITFSNQTSISWPKDSIKFKFDEKNSELSCKEIKYPEYDTPIKETIDFSFIFSKDIKYGKYKCYFDVFFKEKKLKDTRLTLKIHIKKKEEE